jgi:hypothetical protein
MMGGEKAYNSHDRGDAQNRRCAHDAHFSDNGQDGQPMTDFADRFRIRYSTLTVVWKALAEGETPERFPVEWKSINYYAHVFSNDIDVTVKTAAQAFLRDVEVARLDAPTFATRLMLATQTFAQTICDQAGILWQEDRRAATLTRQVRQAPKSSAKPKAGQRSPARTNTRKTGRPT